MTSSYETEAGRVQSRADKVLHPRVLFRERGLGLYRIFRISRDA